MKINVTRALTHTTPSLNYVIIPGYFVILDSKEAYCGTSGMPAEWRKGTFFLLSLHYPTPRPLDYGRLFTACSAVSAVWAVMRGLVCKELHMLELHFLFSVHPFFFHVAPTGLAARLVSLCPRLFTAVFYACGHLPAKKLCIP